MKKLWKMVNLAWGPIAMITGGIVALMVEPTSAKILALAIGASLGTGDLVGYLTLRGAGAPKWKNL